MDKAVIDTTVLTDILLNSGKVKEIAQKALNLYKETILPVYAIKEFKAGPLNNFAWMYNTLSTTNSFFKSLDALQKMSRTPKRYTTSTAIQALKEASSSLSKYTSKDLFEKYGDNASVDKMLCDEFRLSIRFLIFSSWKKRRKITSDVEFPLTCYIEKPPYIKRNLIYLDPKVILPRFSGHS